MFARKEFRVWITACHIPALSSTEPLRLKPKPRPDPWLPTQLLEPPLRQRQPEFQDPRLPLPHPAPKQRKGKGRKKGRGGRSKESHFAIPHRHTQEPLLQSKPQTYPVSHLRGPLIIATI